MLLMRPKMPYRSRTSIRPELLEAITIIMYVKGQTMEVSYEVELI